MSDAWRLTGGEHALVCLDSIGIIDQQGDSLGGHDALLGRVAVDFVRSSFGLMVKFPGVSRRDFARILPFTDLEQTAFMDTPNTLDSSEVRARIVHRLGSWVRTGTAMVEGEPVQCGDFLRAIEPHLDRWDDRQFASRMAEDMDRRAMDAVS